MPQASSEMRDLMMRWFPEGQGVDDAPPYRFLKARGWNEHSGMWSKPTYSYNPSIYEVKCLLFLRDEWDYDFVKPLYPEV